ncbi:hypothetical protein DYB26_014785, partial [Aphanomyces astaci]
AIAKSIRNHVDELIKLEKTAITRSCALVYASLSPTVKRDAAARIRYECYASSGPPGYAPSGHSGYASPDYGAYRDDQRGRSPFRQSASRYRSRSGDRYRDYREDRGYYCDDSGSYRDDRGSYRDDSGANQDDRHHRSRSRSAPLVDQGYAHQASTPQRGST